MTPSLPLYAAVYIRAGHAQVFELCDKARTVECDNVLKGVCHKIFDLQFFSGFEPIWAPDKQAKVFLNSISISRDIRS